MRFQLTSVCELFQREGLVLSAPVHTNCAGFPETLICTMPLANGCAIDAEMRAAYIADGQCRRAADGIGSEHIVIARGHGRQDRRRDAAACECGCSAGEDLVRCRAAEFDLQCARVQSEIAGMDVPTLFPGARLPPDATTSPTVPLPERMPPELIVDVEPLKIEPLTLSVPPLIVVGPE